MSKPSIEGKKESPETGKYNRGPFYWHGLTLIITWVWCFFPGFDRFTPGFDRSIPGFDRFMLASIPVTGILPYTIQMHVHQYNVHCFVFWHKFFYYIWNKYFVIKNKCLAILKTNIFLNNTVDTNPSLLLSHFNATGCRQWSTGGDKRQSSVVNSMQREPSEIAVVQISRTEYVMKCYHDMVDQIPQKRTVRP